MIRHQFSQVQLTSNDWLRLAASTLAASTRAAAVVTPARSRRAKFAHLQLVDLADHARMAVVVLTDGTVIQRHLDPSALTRVAGGPATQEDLDSAAAELNTELNGLTAPQARRRARKLTPLAAHVAASVAELLEEADGTHDRGGLHRRPGLRPRPAGVRRRHAPCARSSRSSSTSTSSSSCSRS